MECLPIKTLEDLHSWSFPAHYQASTPLSARTRASADTPRTLVCHDMKEGYLGDRFTQGVFKSQGILKSGCYTFYHWQYVDTFVYFGHYFISLPPVTWINCAHRHGVPVLGTFITEWDDGAARCAAFLESEDTYRPVIEKLVKIAKFCNFDGWLVNIENKIQETQVQNLLNFLTLLTEEMHKSIPHSQVLWYDSVISTGELKWQNELNENNSDFFDACDGIYVNYTWKEENLQQSVSAATKHGRLLDVYVGVDVFGRGCVGGGGYNTKEAVSLARNHGMSVALFAPGWVYEKHGAGRQHEDKFWQYLEPLCPVRSPSSLPLRTSFCQGRGQKFYGKHPTTGKMAILNDQPWYHLSLQQLQPSYTNAQFKTSSTPQQIQYFEGDAYRGGGCLRISGSFPAGVQELYYKLFSLDVNLSTQSTPLHASYTWKSENSFNEYDCIFLKLRMKNGDRDQSFILSGLAETNNHQVHLENNTKEIETLIIRPYNVIVHEQHNDSDISQWETRHFTVEGSHGIIKEIGVVCFHDSSKARLSQEFSVLLGALELSSQQDRPSSSKKLPVIEAADIKLCGEKLNCNLHWKSTHQDEFYSVFYEHPTTTDKVDYILLGHAHENFCVRELDVPKCHPSMKFLVQPYGL